MQFRTDISFLRALSVLVVLFYHFGIAGFEGGFVGVDVFFVISGFLMTQITLKSFDKNQFSLLDFYKRRAKRIIPPMHAMLYFVLLISVVFFFVSDVRLNAKFVALATFFSSNLYFWQYLNYFTSGDNILLHTWSLGVEWQFYLIYPLVLLALRPVYFSNKARFWWILGALTLLSFVWMLMVFATDNNFSFYMLPTRYWELSIGGLAYFSSSRYDWSKGVKQTLTWLSIAVILVSVFSISESNVWPSYLTVFPVLAATLILCCNWPSRVFSNPVVQFFGDISYSLYLWHWPWFILFKYFGLLSTPYILLLLVLSIGSATLSYYAIERQKWSTNLKLIGISTMVLTLLSVGLFVKPELSQHLSMYKSDQFKIGNFYAEYTAKYVDKQFNPCGCYVTDNDPISGYNQDACLTRVENKPNVLLIGDSHMSQFSSALRAHTEYHFLEASMGYTLPLPFKNGVDERYAILENALDTHVFKTDKPVDFVVISAHWLMHTKPSINLSKAKVEAGIEQLVAKLEASKVPYLFIGQSEFYSLTYPKIQMLKQFGRTDDEFYIQEAADMNEMLKQRIPSAHYLEIYNAPYVQRVNEKGDVVYLFDTNHYSNFGAEQVIKQQVLPALQAVLNSTKRP